MSPRPGIDLFRIAGIQIAIDYSWFAIFLLVLWSLAAGYFPSRVPGQGAGWYWAAGAVGTVLFFASVVLHELAHSLTANRLGQRVRRITLFIFGGMAHLSREPRDARSELTIAAVGPAASLALGGLFWLCAAAARQLGAGELARSVLEYLAVINVALALFNLLPGLPLDGGRILRSVLWARTGDLRLATARAASWGGGVALGLMLLGVLQIFGGALIGGLWLIFIGVFLRGAAQASYRGVLIEQALGDATVRDLMVAGPVTALPAELSVAEAIERYFLEYGFGGFPVTEGGRTIGVVSLGDVTRCPAAERPGRPVRAIMRPAGPAVEIGADAPVLAALEQMARSGIGRLLVTDGGRVVGLVTHSAIARFVHVRTELAETG